MEEESQPVQTETPQLPVESPQQGRSWKFPFFIGLLFLFLILTGAVAYLVYSGQLPLPSRTKQIVCTQDAKKCPDGSYVSRTGPNCEFTACPAKPSAPPGTSPTLVPTVQKGQNYSLPSDWQKYSDKESGITISYPSIYKAKYNPNRGVGIGFAAGSYLVDSKGNKILDFYKIPYDGGSRRETYYKVAEFDGPADMSKYAVSAEDVILNGKTYLKLVSSYWEKTQKTGNRVFFFITEGKQMYYFTYPEALEKSDIEYKTILTIVANSSFSPVADQSSSKYISCYPRPSEANKGEYWEASVNSQGEMIIVQRTNKALKDEVDLARLSVSGNNQTGGTGYFTLTDFDFSVDHGQKGSLSDAFVIKVKKADVDKLKEQTPSSIPSIAIVISLSGGVQTTEGEFCKADLEGYYAPKP